MIVLTDKERMSYSASPYRHSLIGLIGLEIKVGRFLLIGYKRDKRIGGLIDERILDKEV